MGAHTIAFEKAQSRFKEATAALAENAKQWREVASRHLARIRATRGPSGVPVVEFEGGFDDERLREAFVDARDNWIGSLQAMVVQGALGHDGVTLPPRLLRWHENVALALAGVEHVRQGWGNSITLQQDPYYVQFVRDSDDTVLGQAVTNASLDRKYWLNDEQLRKMTRRGWLPPGKEANHEKSLALSTFEDSRKLASIAIDLFFNVYGIATEDLDLSFVTDPW